MYFYKITHIVEDEQQERLSRLAERYAAINGWDEEEILQFAVAADSKNDMEAKLWFLECHIDQLEKEWQGTKKKM
ncbi:MAG: hypothetical protein NC305_10025 [Lachnospiraceae bacterium]|nr:hypothetical protein [Lachnospiraceae bacterium]